MSENEKERAKSSPHFEVGSKREGLSANVEAALTETFHIASGNSRHLPKGDRTDHFPNNSVPDRSGVRIPADTSEARGLSLVNGEVQDAILTPSEAAGYLRISVATLLRGSRLQQIPGFQIGTKLWRYRKSQLDECLRSKVSFFRHPCRERRETNDELAATVPKRVPDEEGTHPR